MQDAIQQTKTTLYPNTFQMTDSPGKCLIILFSKYSLKGENIQAPPGVLQLFKLCAAVVLSRFLYKWKKSPSPFGF